MSDDTSEYEAPANTEQVDSDSVTSHSNMPRPKSMPKAAELGEFIGGYKLQSILGRGGMGTVFEGQHRTLGRAAAVKVLAPDLAARSDYISRFFQEARIVNDVRHTNIVEIYDFIHSEDPLRVAFIMEKLEGKSLSELIKKKHKFTDIQAINICLQICDALAAVHAQNVIHRDLKPDNVFITGSLDSDLSYVPSVKILDFGIAKNIEGSASHKTATGTVMGTPAYMAPEQISGSAPNPKSDVYALALVLYEMLTGKRLYHGIPATILRQKLVEERPPIEGLPPGPACHLFESLVIWGLEQNPANRPDTQEFAKGLLEVKGSLAPTDANTAITYLDVKKLMAATPSEVFRRRIRYTTATAQQVQPQIPEDDRSSGYSFGTSTLQFLAKQKKFKIWGVASLLLALAVFGFATISSKPSTPSTAAKSYTPTVPKTNRPAARKIEPLRVTTKPSKALVYDDKTGQHLGTTPLSLVLHPGEQKKIRISKRGYKSKFTILKFGQNTPTIRLKKRRSLKQPKDDEPDFEEFKSKPPANIPKGDILNKKELPSWN